MTQPHHQRGTGPSRRRFIAITAATAGVAALPGAAFAQVPVATWRGIALGAGASATLAGIEPDAATGIFRRMKAELARLENIFSLYRPHSALVRLNKNGHLDQPPTELLEVLSLTNSIHAATNGAFDPTVQPLWILYAKAAGQNSIPTATEIKAAKRRVSWPSVRFDADRIAFDRPHMGLTLNGIAQGYVTDRIADLLRAEGLRGVLVDMGEIHAIGQRPDGGPWRSGLRNPDGGVFAGYVSLQDRALATSAPAATVLDPAGRIGHIFDPRTGKPGGLWRQVSVSARSAALADGLATAFCLTNHAQILRSVAAFENVSVEKLVV